MLTFVQAILLTIIVFLCVYTVVDRLCRCIEVCSTNRSYKKFLETTDKENVNGTCRNQENRES